MNMKRGLSYQEAMKYAGVKRRTFDAKWRPKLKPMKQGSSLIFDRLDIDRLFDEFKGPQKEIGGDDAQNEAPAFKQKGAQTWGEKCPASTPPKMARGRSIKSSEVLDFVSASAHIKKQKIG